MTNDRFRTTWRPLACALLVACSGCASKPVAQPPAPQRTGEVLESTIESPDGGRYPLEFGVSYEQPVALGDHPLPAYPADQLSKRLPPQQVDVRVIVASDGTVVRVEPLTPPEEHLRPFVDATVAALSRWEFSPLRRIEDHQYRELPFHQDYRFTFTQKDGRPQVDQGR